MQKADLKPCPFCGSNNLGEDTVVSARESRGVYYLTCCIECLNCGAEGPNVEINDGPSPVRYDMVRKAWNTRNRDED